MPGPYPEREERGKRRVGEIVRKRSKEIYGIPRKR
jgi:hypothetical protein